MFLLYELRLENYMKLVLIEVLRDFPHLTTSVRGVCGRQSGLTHKVSVQKYLNPLWHEFLF